MEYVNCPNCNTEIKNKFMSVNLILPKRKIEIINQYHQPKAEAYCNKCGDQLFEQTLDELNSEIKKSKRELIDTITSIPVITIQQPKDWDYTVINMVTAQSVTGTGVISEFTSSFTDMFGLQSNRYNTKIKKGEELCKAQLRQFALDAGANAIIGVDIDYTEVGGEKGMLMVCMAGTAIYLKNTTLFDTMINENINKSMQLNNRLNFLNELLENLKVV